MIKVLIVDDEFRVCQLICNLIDWGSLDMQIIGVAHNGIEARELARETVPDLVITDIRMPGYDGMELLKRARIQNPDMEFIIISGYSHFEYAQTAIRYGVSDYILKPVNEEALNATLQKVRQRYMEHQVLTEKNLEQKKQKLGIQIERTKICGGGAKSLLWRQMVADILNIKVDIPKSEEGPSMGGAMLAAVACGEYASVEEAAEKIVEVVDTVEPIPENAARYEKQYQKFRRIYPTVKELFPIIE